MAPDARKRHPSVTDPRAAERRRSLAIRIGATAVVVIIAIAVAVWLIVSKDDEAENSAGSGVRAPTPPSVVTDTGAYRVNSVAAPKATVTLIEDFQCPVCKEFETVFADALTKIRANPAVAVDYKPVAILDRLSSTRYSTRAANASACVAQATATKGDYAIWLAYHDALYAQQPAEQSAGLTDEQLTRMATDAGAPASVSSCIDDGTFSDWVTAQTQKAISDNLQGTPQVELNGKMVELSSPADLLTAVNAAAA